LHCLEFAEQIEQEKYIDKQQISSIQQFVFEKSTVSLIHYFNTDKSSNAPYTEEGRNICDSHKDTGMLTIALTSVTPGLQIWDRIRNGFVKIEEEVEPMSDLVIFPGEKLTLFSKKFPATVHRVIVGENVERFSCVFLLDSSK